MRSVTQIKLDELYDAIANGNPYLTHKQAVAWVRQAHAYINGTDNDNRVQILHNQTTSSILLNQNTKKDS